MTDLTIDTLHAAMRGLSLRQRAFADNIANLETPGFTASRVVFEDSLRDALRSSRDPLETNATRLPSRALHQLNGNNVNLDDEIVGLTEAGLKYQLMVEALSSKFRLLRTAVKGGA